MPVKSPKVEQFCYEIGYLNVAHTRAYIHAYPKNHYPAQSSQTLLQQIYVQNRIRYWQEIKAKEIEEKKAKDAARLIISRERQTTELEKLRKKCMRRDIKDYATALGCLREENKVYGLVIDVQAAGDEVLQQVNDEAKKIADKIPDSYLLESPKCPELSSVTENPASQDDAGLKKSDKSDVNYPPEQAQ